MPFSGRPEHLADKYAKMAADRYDFYRGSAPLFYADVATLGDRVATSFVDDPETAAIVLFGDPHPENLGTSSAGGVTPAALGLEVTDLDASRYGP
jgi:uncharacterized protein (DUF2252 family)